MSELKRHKRSDAIKWTATAVAFLFVAIVLVGVCLQVFGKGKVRPSEWFKPDETEQTTPDNGLIVTPGENKSGISLNVQKAAANADENDADTYTVTATVLPNYADDKSVDWSLAYAPVIMTNTATNKQEEVILGADGNLYWANDPDSQVEFQMGSTSEYNVSKRLLEWLKANPDPSAFVTVTPTSDGAATATVKCLQAFRVCILLKVTSRSNPSVFADCILEHYSHPEAIAVYLAATDLGLCDLTNTGSLSFTFSGSTRGLTTVYVDLQTTLSTQGASEIGYPQITKVQVSETAEYVAELNKTDMFTSAATVHTKTLSSNSSGYRSMTDGKGFPLSLADSSMYNLTTLAARESAMCLALRNLGDKPFFVFHITVQFPDAAVSKFGYTKTVVYDLPVYADIDSLSVSTTGVELDTTEIVF